MNAPAPRRGGRTSGRRLRASFTAVAVATLFMTAGPGAQTRSSGPKADPRSAHDKFDASLRPHAKRAGSALRQVIVRASKGSRGQLRALVRELGGSLRKDHAGIDAVTIRVPENVLAVLAAHPLVETISEDAIVGAGQVSGMDTVYVQNTTSTGTSTPAPRHLRETLGVTSSWNGAGIGVAVVDSGIAPTPDLAGRIRAFYDFTNGGVAKAAYDDYGHGTHVAGLIGGAGKATAVREYEGVAPGVAFIGLKVLDANGAGQTSNVIAAIEFATANKAALGIDILNLSLGHRIFESAATDPLVRAVEAASRAGIVVIVSAGNVGMNPDTGAVGYAGITSPGNAPSAITVGSVNTQETVARGDDRVANYSSRGPTWYDAYAKPNVVAPGHRLPGSMPSNATLWTKYPTLQVEPGYLRLSGTSMATGVVSGVAALMLQAHRAESAVAPRLTSNTIKAALQFTSFTVYDDAGVAPIELVQGAGSVNAAGAVELARAIDTTQPRGTSWLRSWFATGGHSSVIGGQTLLWSTAVVWGDAVVWGNTISHNWDAWGEAVVWGNDAVVWGNSDAVVWGNNDDAVVWGNSAVWANCVVWGNSLLEITGNSVVWGNLAGQ